jgi:hypothetical protein
VADMQNPQPADPNEALERLSLRELSMDNLLQTVADLTKTVMPRNPETSESLLVKDHPTTVVSTGDLATYQAKGILVERHKHRRPGVPTAGAGLDDDPTGRSTTSPTTSSEPASSASRRPPAPATRRVPLRQPRRLPG